MQKRSQLVKAAVNRLHARLQSADFDGALRLLQHLKTDRLIKGADEFNSLRFKCLTAEILDFFGDYPAARKAIEIDGRASDDILRTPVPPQSVGERALLKQRVWAAIHWGYVLYRAHMYDEAREVFIRCERVLREHVATKSEPCFFTFSRIWYSLGLVHRQTYKYEEAKHAFMRSIDLSWDELREKGKHFSRKDSIGYSRARALSDYCVAKSMALGLGWIFYTESALDIARSFVTAAKILLAGTRDRVITSYVDVIYGGIQRSAHADDKVLLGEAIDVLRKSYKTFSADKNHRTHKAYKLRAAIELSLVYLQGYQCGALQKLDALQEAEKYAKEAETLAKGDERWVCNSLIIKSRIHRSRGQYQQALDVANTVLEQGSKQVFVKIDAWIARGEAALGMNPPNHEAALENFFDALKYGGANPKVRAVCYLHLANAYLRIGDIRKAGHYFGACERMPERANAFIRMLARRVKNEIMERRKDFTVPFSDNVRKASDIELEFHGALTEWARHKMGTDAKAAQALGITVATFYKWRAAAGLPKKPPT